MSSALEARDSEKLFSHEKESSPMMDYGVYRELCDMTDNFRKVGIQDRASFEAVLQDTKTVFIEYQGYKIPLLASLQYEKMYHVERTLAMSDKKNAMLLAIPFSHLQRMGLDERYELDEDIIVVVEEFVSLNDEQTSGSALHDISRLPFENVTPFNFENEALASRPDHATAWMAAYEFDAQPRRGSVRMYEGQPLIDEVMYEWKKYCQESGKLEVPEASSTGTFLLSAEQLSRRPDLKEQLWEISQIGFGKILGEGHPVSMEFNEEFFESQIRAKNTMTAVHCIDGEAVCFGFVGLDMKNNEWLNENSATIQDLLYNAKKAHKALVHVHELIGRGKKGMGYASRIVETFFEAVSRTSYSYSVFFESTNLSSLYIPPLIMRSLERSESMISTSEIKTLGKLSYWGLVAQ